VQILLHIFDSHGYAMVHGIEAVIFNIIILELCLWASVSVWVADQILCPFHWSTILMPSQREMVGVWCFKKDTDYLKNDYFMNWSGRFQGNWYRINIKSISELLRLWSVWAHCVLVGCHKTACIS